jgi:hypothetical protein
MIQVALTTSSGGQVQQPVYMAAPPMNYPTPEAKAAQQTIRQAVEVSYSGVVQATTLNTVTHLAYDSVHTLAVHRQAILAENPEVSAELNALMFMHVQALMYVQRQVVGQTDES